uniref:Putative ovule protein n=1 Tax=Solanum chacoense TaxID=4108 RepID=A0A0V0GUT7_SOLCH
MVNLFTLSHMASRLSVWSSPTCLDKHKCCALPLWARPCSLGDPLFLFGDHQCIVCTSYNFGHSFKHSSLPCSLAFIAAIIKI